MNKKNWGWILQLPVFILLGILFISFIYLSFTGYGGITPRQFVKYGIPIWIIIILYIWGRILQTRKDYPQF